MDPLLIALASVGALLALASASWWRARRGRQRAKRTTAGLQADLRDARQSQMSLRVGEREAAWAATATAQRLDRTMLELGKANHDVERLEGDLDDLRTRLGAADRDLDRLRADHDQASTRIAILEGDLDRSNRERTEATRQLEATEGLEQRLYAVVKERDRLSAAAQRGEQLEAELAALGRVHQDLASARSDSTALRQRLETEASDLSEERDRVDRLQIEIAGLRSQLGATERQVAGAGQESRSVGGQVSDSRTGAEPAAADDRLVASEAARRDLEARITGLSAARSAEQRAATERISRLERLHTEIAARDRQIAQLEEAIDGPGPAGPDTGDGGGTSTYAEWDVRLRQRVTDAVSTATTRLRDRVEHLRAVIAEKERLLSSGRLTAAPDPGALPVTTIRGIGPAIEAILAEHGITSVQSIAGLTDSQIDRLAREMPVYPDRIRHDDWVGQALALTELPGAGPDGDRDHRRAD